MEHLKQEWNLVATEGMRGECLKIGGGGVHKTFNIFSEFQSNVIAC